LARAYRLLERALDGLSLADFRVLSAIGAGEERASRLAARLALGKPAISATVESLCRRDLLRRSPLDADQRVLSIALTSDGAAVLADAERRLSALVDDLAARTPDPAGTLAALAALDVAIDARRAEQQTTQRVDEPVATRERTVRA